MIWTKNMNNKPKNPQIQPSTVRRQTNEKPHINNKKTDKTQPSSVSFYVKKEEKQWQIPHHLHGAMLPPLNPWLAEEQRVLELQFKSLEVILQPGGSGAVAMTQVETVVAVGQHQGKQVSLRWVAHQVAPCYLMKADFWQLSVPAQKNWFLSSLCLLKK